MTQPTITKAASWENEAGRAQPFEYAASLGVVRHVTESFSVGGYRYTNLGDAVGQARRMKKLEGELL